MIQKKSATALRKAGRNYVVLSPESLAAIESPEALAVWVYLQSKSEGWIVRRKDIMNRFSMGRDKSQNAINELKECRLIETIESRNEDGTLKGKELVVYSEPNDVLTDRLNARPSAEPSDGESGDIDKYQSLPNDQGIDNNQVSCQPSVNAVDMNIGHLFGFWKETMKKSGATKLDSKRKTAIKNRLKDGYSVEDIRLAIINCSLTPHNMGQNDRGQKFNDIELICRNAANLERFMESNPMQAQQQSADFTGQQSVANWAEGLENEFHGVNK